MRCNNCGEELAQREGECPYCGQQLGEVKVLTAEERENFQGVTLESESGQSRHYQYESSGPSRRVYVRQMTFGSSGMSLWTKLVILLVLAFLVFVFLPVAVFIVVALSLIWFIFRIVRK